MISRLTLLATRSISVFVLLATAASSGAEPTHARIEWNPASLTFIQEYGMYGRMIRLQNGELLCGFDVRGRIQVLRSSDDGQTWRDPVLVAQWEHGRLTNTELLQLKSGALLCMFNERPRRSSGDKAPFSIAISRSDDDGETWQEPMRIHSAGAEFENGCWEPAAIQLPSGEVQLFFANEGPYRDSDEQEITLLRSNDDGRTWREPETISFRPNHRDGMPVPLLLNNGKGIALAIEDNGLSGNFKPVIVYSTIDDNWRSGVRTPDSASRWSALDELPPPQAAASAPYLRQMPSGETILSYQQSESGRLEDAQMMVSIGNAEAKNFGPGSRPFPPTKRAQLWNSLFVKNDETVVAITETAIDDKVGIWSVEGRFVRK